MVVLGIDAGGSRTTALLADATGRVVSTARGPGANLQSAGELEVEKVLHQLIEDTLGDSPARPAAICLGMAGVDRADDARIIRGILARIGYRARALVVNDALIALEAGLPGTPGIVMIAGTGSIGYGRDDRGQAARAGGLGHVLSDEGSGYWLGREALRAVVRAADGRGERTALTASVLRHYDVGEPAHLVRIVYSSSARPAEIAALAREVGEVADAGDPVAEAIVEHGASELVRMAESVARQLSLSAPIILQSGGALRGVTRLRDRTEAQLVARLPDCQVRLLDVEPAVGAVR
ncbi:MAG TPA: BadF/BadG/BcrA/BcrD ATPase family protein, partial [Vicinamibacterales bacterium]|nr:BadF/BadG/BcrA/BcrD ATPase family protein [Vicinamibacterales bacterium]